MSLRWSRITAVLATVALAAGLTACSSSDESDGLLVYNAQHESLTKEWIDEFTKETGIKVTYRQGGDTELGNQLIAEGESSPADVFLTENSPAMAAVEKAGLFTDVDQATIDQVPPRFRPATNKWTGIAARATVFVYNKNELTEDQLPKSIMDLQRPEWKGRWGAPPVKADFQAIVAAMLELTGEQATSDWLVGMKANAELFSDNIATLRAVNAAEVPGGIIYHYYWFRDQAETKEISRQHRAALLPQRGPRRVPLDLGRRHPELQQEEGGRPEVPDLHHQQGGPGSTGERHLVRVPGRQRCAGQSRPGATRPTAGAVRQPLEPGRPAGHRPDDAGGPALDGRLDGHSGNGAEHGTPAPAVGWRQARRRAAGSVPHEQRRACSSLRRSCRSAT